MHKFRKSFIALIGVLLLFGIATVTRPHIGRGASGMTSSAPTSQTQNVNVVNTPTVSAQQSGTWNVGINGTPAVSVANFPSTTNVGIDTSANTVRIDTANPLPVRDADNPARQPFMVFLEVGMADGEGSAIAGRQTSVIPGGRRFVIEHLSAVTQLPAGEKVLLVEVFARTAAFLGSTYQATLAGNDWFITSQAVRLYADHSHSGREIQVQVTRDSNVGNGLIRVTISGYLVEVA